MKTLQTITIKGALEALESLKECIHEIEEVRRSTLPEEGVIGWEDDASFEEFCHSSLDYPGIGLKLVSVALQLQKEEA